MAVARRRRSPRFTFVVLLLIAITIITVYYRGHARTLVSGVKGVANDVVDPIGHFFAALAHPVEHFFQGAADYGSLVRANARLRSENAQLRAQIGAETRAVNELNQLKAQEDLPFLQGMATVTANVIDQTPSDFEASIEIDKGSSSGVATGMPVISGGALVGTVVEASAHYSIVQLITDGSTKIAVTYSGGPGHPTETAVVDGQGAGAPLSVEYVGPHEQLHRGEMMVTSGLAGGTLPPDIPVGTVRSVTAGAGSLQQNVALSPVAGLANLQFVAVVEWEPVNP